MRPISSIREQMRENKLHHVRNDPKLERNPRPIKIIRPSEETVVCPFDPYHIIDKNYLDRHLTNCASSSNQVNIKSDVKPAGVVPLESYRDLTVPVMKDWEEEEVSTYDPYINTQGRKIIRYLVLVPKSQKKHFRQSERLRIQLLEKADREGPHKEICEMIRNLGKDSLWEVLLMYIKRLDIECCETIIENFDFEKLIISEPSTASVKEEETEGAEKVLNIEVEKLFNRGFNATRDRRGSISDCITTQFGSLLLNVPQE